MTNRYFNILVLSTLVLVGVFSCKKDTPKVEPPVTDVKCDEVRDVNKIFFDVPNLDFEFWYSGKSAQTNAEYFNPSPSCFWATPNNGSGEIGSIAKVPIVVFRVGGDSAYSGNYAAMLKTGTGQVLGKSTIVAATVASGDFEIDISNPLQSLKFGKAFNKKPKTVTGYYRYFPVAGDSSSAYCYVTKKISGNKIDTIGIGRKIFYDLQDQYKKFEFDVEYKNEETPDNIVIYFSSSEAGDEFKGQAGNTLFIDKVSVGY